MVNFNPQMIGGATVYLIILIQFETSMRGETLKYFNESEAIQFV